VGSSSLLTIQAGSAPVGNSTLNVTSTSSITSHTTPISLSISTGGFGGIKNGGFERGTLAGWTSQGTASVVSPGHTGAYAAALGASTPTGVSTLAQIVTAPLRATTLTVWYQIFCTDPNDWVSATVRDNTTGVTGNIVPQTCSNTGTWATASVSITGGHSLTITLTNQDDGQPVNGLSSWWDDIALH
jgi:serine protease